VYLVYPSNPGGQVAQAEAVELYREMVGRHGLDGARLLVSSVTGSERDKDSWQPLSGPDGHVISMAYNPPPALKAAR
jgi:hypothetical protein